MRVLGVLRSGSGTRTLRATSRKLLKDFDKLSQRAHPLAAAFNLMTREDGGAIFVTGNFSKDMFVRDAWFRNQFGRSH